MNIPLAAVIALYVPIVVMSTWATWLLFSRLFLPAWRSRTLDVDRYALGLGALCAMASHAWENMLYGAARWSPSLTPVLLDARFAVVGKLLILAGAVFTLGGVLGGVLSARAIVKLALVLWLVAFGLALIVLH